MENTNVNQDIILANNIINNNNNYSYFFKLYSFSNENSLYLKKYNYYNKNALTVGSSADQIINLINYGCQDITLVDLNPFVKYYYDLKKAAIFVLNPQEYLNFFYNSIFFSFKKRKIFDKNLYQKLSKYLNKDSKLFWNNIINNYSNNKIKKNFFHENDLFKKDIIKNNNYLINDNFNSLRNNLEKTNVKFINTNIITNPPKDTLYDYIILSNIFDYAFDYLFIINEQKQKIINKNYLESLKIFSNLLKEEGTLFFHYIWQIDDTGRNLYSSLSNQFKEQVNYQKIIFDNNHHFKDTYDCMFTYKKIRK